MKKIMLAAASAAALAAGAVPQAAGAQNYYLGEIILGGWSYCPSGSTPAAGQLMSIQQFSALFSLYGTTYGGDGRTTFGLPDLRGRFAVAPGTGPGLPSRSLGQRGGANAVTQTVAQMPSHSHAAAGTPRASIAPGDTPNPAGALPSASTVGSIYGTTNPQPMLAESTAVTVENAGGGQSMDITNPFLALQFCVILDGIFPSRN